MHLFFPLISSILYVVAALFLKQAANSGNDLWRTAFICNFATAVLFAFLWPLGGNPIDPNRAAEFMARAKAARST